MSRKDSQNHLKSRRLNARRAQRMEFKVAVKKAMVPQLLASLGTCKADCPYCHHLHFNPSLLSSHSTYLTSTDYRKANTMQEIKSLSQFNSLKSKTLLIVDFYATWCGPCKAISPVFDKLSKQHEGSTSIIFAKCDVDKAKDVAQTCGITAMPTFQFYKEGKKVDEVKGADVQQLTTKIGYYTSAAAKETPKQGGASSSSSAPSTSGNLGSLIDIGAARLISASLMSNARNIVSPPPAGAAISSATGSAKVLIHLPFKQIINPSHIKITIAKDSLSNAPSRVQIGSNVPVRVLTSPEGVETHDLTFDSISKAQNNQSYNVYSDEYNNGITELKLKASKFTGVKSLTIRIDANLSGDEKTITKIGVMEVVGTSA